MPDKFIRHGETYNGDGSSSVASTGASISSITVASPAVITSNGHGLANDTQIFLNGTVPTGLNTTTRYYVRNAAANTFEVSLTAGGASINTTAGSTSGASWNRALAAWNDINIFEGTAITRGSIAAGDTVYIRSKDAGGADITRTASGATNLGSAAATDTLPVRWVVDGGSVWSGINGIVKYQSSTFTFTVRSYNELICEVQDALQFYCNNAAANAQSVIAGTWFTLRNVLIDFSLDSSSVGPYIYTGPYVFENVHIKSFDRPTFGLFRLLSTAAPCFLFNTDIELLKSTETNPLMVAEATNAKSIFIGGGVRGVGAGASVTNPINVANGSVELVNFSLPADWPFTTLQGITSSTHVVRGCGVGGLAGGIKVDAAAFYDSRNDGNYPTLNATLPDSTNTPWAWKINPVGTSVWKQLSLEILKVYTQAAAIKTLTLELLVRTSWAGSRPPDKENLWLDVIYTDNATGAQRYVSSRVLAGGTLDSSTAAWTSTSWGVVSCTKRKLSITTPTSIKQNTMVTAILRGWCLGSGVNDVIFVCPDPQLT